MCQDLTVNIRGNQPCAPAKRQGQKAHNGICQNILFLTWPTLQRIRFSELKSLGCDYGLSRREILDSNPVNYAVPCKPGILEGCRGTRKWPGRVQAHQHAEFDSRHQKASFSSHIFLPYHQCLVEQSFVFFFFLKGHLLYLTYKNKISLF